MRGAVLASLGFLSTLGCSGPPTPQGPKTTGDQAAATFGGVPLVTPGERMTYRLSLKGIELAVFEFGVGDVTDVGGKAAILVQSHAKTTGLAAMVSEVDDSFTSWLDVTTGRSLRFQADEMSTTEKGVVEHVTVDYTARTGNALPVSLQIGDEAAKVDQQTVTGADVWDFNSFLVALRAWEPAAGASVSIEAMRSRWMWHIDAKVAGSEKLVTELGELPALKFEHHAYKLGRDAKKYVSQSGDSYERDFTIWVSDDQGRVPLLVEAITDYGAVKLEIVDYQPGSGTPLRP